MKSDFNSIINSPIPVLVDFYADWCGPCKMQVPVLLEMARTYPGEIKIVKIDVDKNPQVANAYDVQSIPTLMVFKNGKQLWRGSGVHSAQQIKQVIDSVG